MNREGCLQIDGVLLVDKSPDWTSHDVVNLVRRRFNIAKTGHCGTLDPMATGLLVILLGKATKLQDVLMGQDKTYEAVMRLGVESDSEDATGAIVAERGCEGITAEQIRAASATFLGDIEQIPPMVSAIKQNGQRLYDLARKGRVVERAPRPVTIHALDILSIALPDVSFRLRCSKGTYVRTICADWGRALGCGGLMSALRRTHSGAFCVDGAPTPEQLKEWTVEQLCAAVVSVETVRRLYGLQGA